MAAALPQIAQSGFSFDLYARNQFLERKGVAPPKSKKTGTTIAGVIFKDGVVLGADTRATEGPIVCDKNCEKIHYIASNIYCCGAGTSADTENSTALVSSQLKLHSLNTRKEAKVVTALTLLKRMLFRYQGHVSAALVLGGVDNTGPHLHTVYPHGSTDTLPFVTMGSGSLAAMAIFEAGWRPNMEKEEAVELVHQAILSGIFNDLGSGSNVDICVITKEGVDMRRNMDTPNPRPYHRKKPYDFPRGFTPVIKTTVQKRVTELLEDDSGELTKATRGEIEESEDDDKMKE
ncbi:Proteasome subunit beta type-7 [Balamuthia mandrillaris]